MAYAFESRVRYSEAGEDGCLTLPGLANYFQDACIFESEDLGIGSGVLMQRDRAWFLISWQIVIRRFPKIGERISVSTWPFEFRGMMGKRNFVMETTAGNLLSCANSIWAFMDLRSGNAVTIDHEIADLYTCRPPYPMQYAGRKIPIPADNQTGDVTVVHQHQLDSNHHVNNGQYLQMARELIGEDFPIGQVRAEYKKQAVLGDRIMSTIGTDGNRKVVSLHSEDGTPYAIVEFQNRESEDKK